MDRDGRLPAGRHLPHPRRRHLATSWSCSAQDWDGWTAHDDTYVVDGENVVVLARYTATHRTTGKALNVRVAHHFVVRGGLIVRFEQFVDTALVAEAARPDGA